jgi:hypothetical protein
VSLRKPRRDGRQWKGRRSAEMSAPYNFTREPSLCDGVAVSPRMRSIMILRLETLDFFLDGRFLKNELGTCSTRSKNV